MHRRHRLSQPAQFLWRCPRCKRRFANANQSHACGRYTLAEHLAGKSPAVIALYRRFAKMVRACGPVTVVPEKTRIAFQVRMSFAAVVLKRKWLDGHVVLARRLEDQRFRSIQTFSPRNHVHQFRIETPDQLDDRVSQWLREAYAVGEQQHLQSRKGPAPERRPSNRRSANCFPL